MYREVKVYLQQDFIGFLRQTERGYEFEYAENYQGKPLSLSLPRSKKQFFSPSLFPYFASLVPEGWLKKRYAETQRIDEKDIFSLLVNNGNNLIGAISIRTE